MDSEKTTRKLYYLNNRQQEFSGKLLDQWEENGQWMAVLDQTLFYPEGGGQPSDIGWLNDIPVKQVEKRDRTIIHHVAEKISDSEVHGRIDWEHRHDFMQQHTGQHLLSGVLWELENLKTVSVNMSKDYTTIEVENGQVSEESIRAAESRANKLIRKNIPVHATTTVASELHRFNLRRESQVKGEIRLVHIGEYDCVACGGVHLKTTGEIGLIRAMHTEKIRGNTRIYWKIGNRAYQDYREKTDTISKLKSTLNVNESGILEKIDLLKEEIGQLKSQKSRAEKKLIENFAEQLPESGTPINHMQVIHMSWQEESDPFLVNLIKALIEKPNRIVCFVNRVGSDTFWKIGCSKDIVLDFKTVRARILKPFNTKGGGKAPIWQGIGDLKDREGAFLDSFVDLMKEINTPGEIRTPNA